jgi:o-succinylbenzoate synthase
VKRTLLRLSLPFREPFATSAGVFASRDIVLLRLEDSDGVRGYGEAASFEPFDGVPLDQVLTALSAHQVGKRPPQARAAEEMARLDLDARRDDRPVVEPGADAIPVNLTLSGGPPEEVAARAREGLRQGYSCFKLKVGLPDDEQRVAAVREAIGEWPALRIDANGAWSADEAIAAIRALERHDLQFVEQPCATLEDLAEVRRRVSCPIAADESVSTPDDVRAAVKAEACDVVNVKLAMSGGIGSARETLHEAQSHGLATFMSSTLDGPWGIAAALQVAAAEPLSLACGLATLQLFDGRLARALPRPSGGLMRVPQGPGLGVEVDDEVLSDFLVEEIAG